MFTPPRRSRGHHIRTYDPKIATAVEDGLEIQDVGKPGIPPGTDAQRWSRAHEIAGSNPAVLTDPIAVGPVLVRVGGC